METTALRRELIRSLQDVYQLEAFSALAELLQGESLVLNCLLSHREGVVYPSDLSRELHLSRPRITAALQSLQRKELIAMHRSPADRRRIQVSITDAGREAIGGRLVRMHAYFDKMLSGLGEPDARTLIRLIDRCVEVMDT